MEHSEDNALGVVLGNVSIWGGINQKDFLFLFALIKPLQGKICPAALSANCAGCLNFFQIDGNTSKENMLNKII